MENSGGRIALIFIVTAMLSGCASFSNYQTAQVLEKGDDSYGIAVTSTTIGLADTDSVYFGDITYTLPELSFRRGVTKNLDAGVKLFPIGVIIDAKYQFMDSETFDMAADLGLSYQTVTFGDSKTTFLDIYPALLATYNLSESFSATVAPKIMTRYAATSTGENKTFIITGGTFTLAFGKTKRMLAEVGYFTGENVSFSHYGVGFAF